MVDRLETVVLLVTGRETKAGGGPTEPSRLAVVETLDEVERVLGGSDRSR
jgi:threonine synthase